jgi:hypothetical protein
MNNWLFKQFLLSIVRKQKCEHCGRGTKIAKLKEVEVWGEEGYFHQDAVCPKCYDELTYSY